MRIVDDASTWDAKGLARMQGYDAIVFLDLDGVCTTRASRFRAVWGGRIETDPQKAKLAAAATLDPALVARVQRVCGETGAAVVLVSGWRRRMSCDDVFDALRANGLTAPSAGGLVDATPETDTRCVSARVWLREHPEVTRWVILDDTLSHWIEPTADSAHPHEAASSTTAEAAPWCRDHLVVPVDGVTEEYADAAVRILGAVTRSG